MSVSAALLRRIAKLSPEAMVEMLNILADRMDDEESRLAPIRARTALYRERGGGRIPDQLRAEILSRDGFKCLDCGSDDHLQMDHIIPVSKGGPTTAENLQTLCRPCNARKRDRDRKRKVITADATRKELGSGAPPRVGAHAETPTTNSSVPPQEKPRKKKQQISADALVSLLRTVLDEPHAQALADYRLSLPRVKTDGFTEYAAKLLLNDLRSCSAPEEAADEMIRRGWLTVKPQWLRDRDRPSTGPPRQASNGLAAYARKRFGLNGISDGSPSRPPSEPQFSGPTLDLGTASVPEPSVPRPALGAPQPRPGWPTRQ